MRQLPVFSSKKNSPKIVMCMSSFHVAVSEYFGSVLDYFGIGKCFKGFECVKDTVYRCMVLFSDS